ncbi:MAG: hypothetical protein V2A79_01095 [Planctomycetota bacterium]
MAHTRRIRVGAVVVLLALGWTALARAGKLLKNSSFETPLDESNWGCDMAAGWIRWGNWMNRETGWAPTHSGQYLIGFHHWRLKGEDNAGFYQDVPEAKAGQKHIFTIHAWVDKTANADSIALEIHSLHGGSVLASEEYSLRMIKEGEWIPLSVSAVPPAAGLRVMVIVEPKKQGMRKAAVKFDDADLEVQ